jgi:hypothetical protein
MMITTNERLAICRETAEGAAAAMKNGGVMN